MGGCEDEGKVDVLSLRVSEIVTDLEHLGVTDHLVDSPEAKLGHDGTELIGDVVEEVDNVFGRTGELLPEIRILGSDTDRAGVKTGNVSKATEREGRGR